MSVPCRLGPLGVAAACLLLCTAADEFTYNVSQPLLLDSSSPRFGGEGRGTFRTTISPQAGSEVALNQWIQTGFSMQTPPVVKASPEPLYIFGVISIQTNNGAILGYNKDLQPTLRITLNSGEQIKAPMTLVGALRNQTQKALLYYAADETDGNVDLTKIYCFEVEENSDGTDPYYPWDNAYGWRGMGAVRGGISNDDEGRIFFGTARRFEEIPLSGENAIHAVDAFTGRQLWKLPMDNPQFALPFWYDGVLYVNDAGNLTALHAENGSYIWHEYLRDDSDDCDTEALDYAYELPYAPPVMNPVTTEIVLTSFKCVFSVITDPAYTGDRVRWKRTTQANNRAPAAISQHGDIYISSEDTNLYKFSSDGRLRWAAPVDNSLSSPPLILGNNRPLVVDTSGVLYYLDDDDGELLRSNNLGELTYANSILGAYPAMTNDGHILIAFNERFAVIGGDGGCAKGTEMNPHVVWPNATDICRNCEPGYYQPLVSSEGSCVLCPEGEYNSEVQATFCFTCTREEWCPGGNNCTIGRVGVACAVCGEGYYTMQYQCQLCPENSTYIGFLFVAALLLGCYILMRWSGGMSYLKSTKFLSECQNGDEISILMPGRRDPEVRVISQVLHDYLLRVDRDFGNPGPVINVHYKLKRRADETAAARWRDGSGLICIPPAVEEAEYNLDESPVDTVKSACYNMCLTRCADNDPEKHPFKALKAKTFEEKLEKMRHRKENPKPLDGLRNRLAAKHKVFAKLKIPDPDEAVEQLKDQEPYDPRSVNGRPTSGLQIFATAVVLGVAYFQMTAIFLQFDLEWNPILLNFVVYLSFLSLNIPDLFTSPECDLKFSFEQKWYFSVTSPLILLFVFVCVYIAANYRYMNPITKRSVQDKCVQCVLVIMTVLYVFMASKAMEPLDCTTQPDGRRSMDANPEIECTFLEGDYARLQVSSFFFFVTYGIGIPSVLFYILYKARKNKKMGDVGFVQRFGWLYLRYNRDYYFWEIFVLVRKLLLVLIQMVYNAEPVSQALGCIMVLAVALAAHLRYMPFACFQCMRTRKRRCKHFSSNDRLEGSMLLGSILVLMMGVLTSQSQGDGNLLAVLMVLIIVSILLLLGFTIYQANRDQEKENKALAREGLYDGQHKGVKWLQSAAGVGL